MTDRAHLSDRARLDTIADAQPPLARLLGVRIVSAELDRVVGEVDVTEALTNRFGALHGGAVMAMADNLGGTAAYLNLEEGEGTTTIESKTNFFRSVAVGDTVRAEAIPLHIGRSTMVWQTTLTRLSDGKVAAIVTQTQMRMRAAKR